jgi:tetratricopeptide (TPR) repeat protein
MKNFKIIILLTLVLIITFVAFSPCLKNRFVNWDDDLYVTKNTVIQSFSFHSVKQIFTSFFVSNYQPLTMLSYLFEYRFFKLAPFGYHLTSLILHLLNCLLVFWLIYILTQRISISSITTLLFGLHPLHVESVAWISERKDLLYTLFFLAAIICYCYYLRTRKIGKYYYFALALFTLSLLSKAMAVILPFILLNIDYFICRERDRNTLIDKIPFFILSFIFGVIAVIGQYVSGAIRGGNGTNLFNKVATANYSIMFYLNKTFMPIKLSCLYPRMDIHFTPELLMLPSIYIILCITILFFGAYKKKIIFSNAFFLISILPVLQFIPIGETIVADRYMYLPSIGIFYLVAEGLVWLYKDIAKYRRVIKIIVLTFLACVISILVLLTRERCKVWKDSLTLWNDVIDKYPNSIMAYNNRGIAFSSKKEYDKAISDFNHVIGFVSDIDRKTIHLYLIGLYRAIGKNEEAMESYNKIKAIDAGLFRQYYESGSKYKEAGKNNEAIVLYRMALELDPNNLALNNELGITYIFVGRFKEAIALFKKVLEINPDFALIHNNLALAYYYEKKYALAIRHCDRAIDLGYVVAPRLLELLNPYRK